MILWKTAVSAVLNQNNNSAEGGQTYRQRIPSSDISNAGRPYTRVTFNASSTEALTLNPIYIGQRADSGDAYDFQATPVELKFSGSSGFAIGAGQTIKSDPAEFMIPTGKDLIISFYTPGDASHTGFAQITKSGWSFYYKGGNDAATVNATGYNAANGYLINVSLVEAGTTGGGGIGISPYPILTKRWWQGWRQKAGLWQPKELGLTTT